MQRKYHLLAAMIMALLCFFPTALADIDTIWGLQGSARVFEENGKLGLMNAECEVLHEAQFDEISLFNQLGYAQVREGDMRGIIDQQGRLVVPLDAYRYVDVYDTDDQTGTQVIVYRPEDTRYKGLLDMQRFSLCEPAFDNIYPFTNGIAPVLKDEKWNFIDASGKVLSERWFDEHGGGSGPPYGIAMDGDITEYINLKGIMFERYRYEGPGRRIILDMYTDDGELIPIHDVEAANYRSELEVYHVRRNGLWGVMSVQGEEIIPCEYESILYGTTKGQKEYFVQKNGLWGVTDLKGSVRIEIKWEGLEPFAQEDYSVVSGGKEGIISYDGEILVKLEWDDIRWWQDIGEKEPSIMAWKKGETACYIDRHGKVLKRLDYHVEWAAGASSADKKAYYQLYFLYDKKGREKEWIIKGRREGDSNGSRILTRIDSKKLSFPYANEGDADCIDGNGYLHTIQQGKGKGFVTLTGEVIINRDWDFVFPLNPYGTGFVMTTKGKYRLIDATGAYVTNMEWEYTKEPYTMKGSSVRSEYDSRFLNMGTYAISKVMMKGADGGSVHGYINDRGELIQKPE